MSSSGSERTRAAREAAARRRAEQGPSEAQLRQRERFIAARKAQAAEQRAAKAARELAEARGEVGTFEVDRDAFERLAKDQAPAPAGDPAFGRVEQVTIRRASYPDRRPAGLPEPEEQPVEQLDEQPVPQPVRDEPSPETTSPQTTKNDGPSRQAVPAWKKALGLTPPRRNRA